MWRRSDRDICRSRDHARRAQESFFTYAAARFFLLACPTVFLEMQVLRLADPVVLFQSALAFF